VAFCREVLGFEPWSKQREVLESVRDHSRTAVRSCHGAGKTAIAARSALWFLAVHPNSRVITTAPTWAQVKDLLWREIRLGYQAAAGYFGGELYDTRLELGVDWLALGLSTDRPERFQGHHAEHLLLVIDEASGVDEQIFEASAGFLTSPGARVLMIGNPTKTSGEFFAAFHSARGFYNTIHVPAKSTPAFTREKLPDDVKRRLVSKQWVEEHERKWGKRSPLYQVRVQAEFPSQSDDVAALIGSMGKGERYETKDGEVVKVEGGKPFAAWTVRGTVTVLGRVLGSAARDGLIPQNPVRRLERGERPATVRREFPSLDRKQIGRLVSATPARYRLLVAVSLLTGLRQGEALGLTWQDVDAKAGVIMVRRQLDRSGELVEPKTSAAKREIPIPPSLSKALTGHKRAAFAKGRAKPSDFVFTSEAGGPMQRRNCARRGLDKALETTGLPHLSWHDLRHVAASALIAEGASVPYVSRVLGHANPSITLSVYAHQFGAAEHAEATRERMEKAFGGLV
jgi:integrase